MSKPKPHDKTEKLNSFFTWGKLKTNTGNKIKKLTTPEHLRKTFSISVSIVKSD